MTRRWLGGSILAAMDTRRVGFSLVEVLVALTLAAVAGAGLTVVQSGHRRLAELAAGHDEASQRVREHLEHLAGLACVADTAGSSSGRWGNERWRATIVTRRWVLVDSVSLPRARRVIVVGANIACPP